MKGRTAFTASEKQRIGTLLIELRSGIPKSQQKKIRDKLRNMGFYITDFDNTYSGFTGSDFFQLIEEKKIKIID
jgi:hypothetical protein